jgi:hypothetical protein
VSIRPPTPRSTEAEKLRDSFLAQLSALSVSATAIAKLPHGTLAKRIAGLDKSGDELQIRLLWLMDEIEASFRIIRQKLLALPYKSQ